MTFFAVLFDMDGVLIDSRDAWHRVISRGRSEWGYAPLSREAFYATFGQGVEADQTQFFPRQTLDRIRRFYDSALQDEIDSIALLPDALDILVELGRRGVKRAVVTNTPIEVARRVLAAKGLDVLLEAVAAAGEAAEKPAPDLILLALSRLAVAPNRALYVGDSQSDLLAARAAGVTMAGLGLDADLRLASLRDVLDLLDRDP